MRAAFLEAHDEFEGVGAHELNPRYDHVDEGVEYDHSMTVADARVVPAFVTARTNLLMALVTERPRLDGVDISHYQYDNGPPNWASVAGIPTWWAATKLTQSTTYLDPTAKRSRMSFLAAGMTHRGLYHWLSSSTDPAEQAWWYLTNLQGLAAGEHAMLDAEEALINEAGAEEWFQCVEDGRKSVNGRSSIDGTKRPGIGYSGAFVAGGTIWQSTRLRESKYGPRPMILAAYTSEVKALALPGVRAYPWQGWQFSSNGPVDGIVGRCDMDRIDDRAAFDLACGLRPTSTPIETIPTTPNITEDEMLPFTHSDNDHDGHPPRFTFWAYLWNGTKRHLSGLELDQIIRADRNAVPALTMAEIDTIPDYVPPAAAGVNVRLSGTWSTSS